MNFLIDLVGAEETTGTLRTFRLTDIAGGYNTGPTDTPANVHYMPRVNQPGSYNRTLFGGRGRTSGVADVDRGSIQLNNIDNGLDDLYNYAFDGYDLTIHALDDALTPYTSRRMIFKGTVEQTEVLSDEVRLQLRSRLAILDVPIQTATFAGTTINGTLKTAEGETNLKDTPKPLLYGAPVLIGAILVNRFFGVYQIGQRFDTISEVRDRGALLTSTGTDYATLTALCDATIASGAWATCKALGLIRVGGNVTQQVLTVKAAEGSTSANRRAGAVVGRILAQVAGLVPDVDFKYADLQALDTAAPYEVEYWTGTSNPTILDVVSEILDSVGASIAPDALGVFRIVQFRGVVGTSKATYTEVEAMDNSGTGILRVPTGDEGNGIPASKSTMYHSRNYAVTSKENLAGTVTTNDPAYVDFVTKEWRQVDKTNPNVSTIHKLAKPIEFETHLTTLADATAEVDRRNQLYGIKRDRFQFPVKFEYASSLDLGDVVTLKLNRFGLESGKNFVIIGIQQDHEEQSTTLELWG